MANEGSSKATRMASFVIRLVVSLLLPAWGLIMIVLGVTWGMGWWIATSLVVLAIGVVMFAGGSLELSSSVAAGVPDGLSCEFIPQLRFLIIQLARDG